MSKANAEFLIQEKGTDFANHLIENALDAEKSIFRWVREHDFEGDVVRQTREINIKDLKQAIADYEDGE